MYQLNPGDIIVYYWYLPIFIIVGQRNFSPGSSAEGNGRFLSLFFGRVYRIIFFICG